MLGWFFDAALSWLGKAVAAAIQAVWKLLAATLLTSPDVTVLPQVRTVSRQSLLVVDAVYMLIVLTAAVLVMTHETLQVRYGLGDLAPRIVIGFTGANLATPACRGLIEVANALTTGLTSNPLDAGNGRQLGATIASAISRPTGPTGLLVILIAVLVAALTVLLLAGALVRIGVLVILTGIAPVALACLGLPQLDGVARLWWRSMLATLGTVTVQAFALHTGLLVFLSPSANLPALGLPSDPLGIINLLLVVCLLWTTVRVPKLMARYAGSSGNNRAPGAVLIRAVLVQSLMRATRLPLRLR